MGYVVLGLLVAWIVLGLREWQQWSRFGRYRTTMKVGRVV